MKRAVAAAMIAVCVLLAVVGGYWLGRGTSRGASGGAGGAVPPSGAAAVEQQVYTCSMHPQVRLDRPGDCPICEMPLIPAASAEAVGSGEAPTLRLSEHALAMASVETEAVEMRALSREVRAVGRIEYNESSLAMIVPRVDGYAERLFVNVTGVEIRAGDHLAEVYSPELLVAQEELLIAHQRLGGGGGGGLMDAATARLRLLGLTGTQVANLIEKGQTTERVTLYSPIGGTVIEKSIVEGGSFKAGDVLFRVANLDSVWAYVEVYEYDLPWVRYGQKVSLVAEGVPGRVFEGLVTFIQPMVDERSRTVRIPVYIKNEDHALRPGMYVTASIAASLTAQGRAAATGVEGKYSCPMHPQVLTESGGACPICEMPLERIPGEKEPPGGGDGHEGVVHNHTPAAPDVASSVVMYSCPMKCEGEKVYDRPGRCPVCKMKLEEVRVASPAPRAPVEGGVLAVPASAVLDSGRRKLVYVERSRGLFEPRELVLGPRAGGYFPVLSGVSAGERVVTRGNFLIDSQFQVTGHPSLLYPGGLLADPGHNH